MFLVMAFTGLGGKVVFGGRSSELLVGFLIGCAGMLSQLCFVLMVIFFVFGQNAPSTIQPSDQAYAAFSLINMIIYFVWTIILVVHRHTITITREEENAHRSKEFSAYDGSQTYNPAIGGGNDDFAGDSEQL